ncbi:MAG TPA: GDSL-type esterase/lipase family protein [Myxococcota bacterium]|nr:GDSL-type esterase/lipase family protein [Myxococcota bacterium]
MMRRRVLACALACLFWGAAAASAQADPPLVITVGDSIVRDYPDYPCCISVPIQGWGKEIRRYFGPGLTWRNDAVGGASTGSFIAEGRWSSTLAAHPQYIMIMFGVNDEQDPNYYADPNTTYRQNLHQMVSDARSIGAVPILVTPPPVRTSPDGTHVSRPNLTTPYADAMTAQGAADAVPVADLHYWLLDTYDALGIPLAQQQYGLDQGGMPDKVHFSPYGADQAARHIVSQLPELQPALAAFLVQTAAPALPPWGMAAFVALLGGAVVVGTRARVR